MMKHEAYSAGGGNTGQESYLEIVRQGKMMRSIIVVTGASAGLGRAIAINAVGRGHKVFGIGRRRDELEETGYGLHPSLYTAIVADVANYTEIDTAIANISAKEGRVDAVFANAAVYPRVSLKDQPAADFMDVLAVNVGGVMATCRAALIPMMRQAHGRIIVVGSFADRHPIANSLAYSVSKGALHALTKGIAVEVGTDYPDILINEWVPGVLNTSMGLIDGIDPAVAADWGLDLLSLPAGGPSGEIFIEQRMETPPLSVRQRIKRRLWLT